MSENRATLDRPVFQSLKPIPDFQDPQTSRIAQQNPAEVSPTHTHPLTQQQQQQQAEGQGEPHQQLQTEQQKRSSEIQEDISRSHLGTDVDTFQTSLSRSTSRKVPGQITESSRRLKELNPTSSKSLSAHKLQQQQQQQQQRQPRPSSSPQRRIGSPHQLLRPHSDKSQHPSSFSPRTSPDLRFHVASVRQLRPLPPEPAVWTYPDRATDQSDLTEEKTFEINPILQQKQQQQQQEAQRLPQPYRQFQQQGQQQQVRQHRVPNRAPQPLDADRLATDPDMDAQASEMDLMGLEEGWDGEDDYGEGDIDDEQMVLVPVGQNRISAAMEHGAFLQQRQRQNAPPMLQPPPQARGQQQQQQYQAGRTVGSRIPHVTQPQPINTGGGGGGGGGDGPTAAVAAERAELLRNLYARYAVSPGQPRIVSVADFAEPRMSASQMQRLVTSMGLMQPAGPFTAETVGLVYARCKPPGARKLNFLHFLRALSALQHEGGGVDIWGAAGQLAARLKRKQQQQQQQQQPQPPPQQQQQLHQPRYPHQSPSPQPAVPPSQQQRLGGGSISVSGVVPFGSYGEDAAHVSDAEGAASGTAATASAPLLLPRLPAAAPHYRSNAAGGSSTVVPGGPAPQVVQRTFTGIAALPQGYALLASNPPSGPAPTAATAAPAPSAAAAAAAAISSNSTAATLHGPPGGPLPTSSSTAALASAAIVQALSQRVASLELQSQEHKTRHAELRLEMLQKLADLTATATVSAAAAAAAAPPPPPQTPPSAQPSSNSADAAHVAVTAAGTAHRAEVGAAAAARVANSAAATAAAASHEAERLAARVSACEVMVQQRFDAGMREQRDAVESVRAQLEGMEGSITALVIAALSEQMEQQLERRLQERLREALKDGWTCRPVPGAHDTHSEAAEISKDGFAKKGTPAEAATVLLSPAGLKPEASNSPALLAWLDSKVSELTEASAAHEARLQQLQQAHDQAAASPSGAVATATAAVAAAPTAAVAATEQRLAGAEAAATQAAVSAALVATEKRLATAEASSTQAAVTAALAATEKRLTGVEAAATQAAVAAAMTATEKRFVATEAAATQAAVDVALKATEKRLLSAQASATEAAVNAAIVATDHRLATAGAAAAEAQRAAAAAAEATSSAASRIDVAIAALKTRLDATEAQILAAIRLRTLSMPSGNGGGGGGATSLAAGRISLEGKTHTAETADNPEEGLRKDPMIRPSGGEATAVTDTSIDAASAPTASVASNDAALGGNRIDDRGTRSFKHMILPLEPLVHPEGSTVEADGNDGVLGGAAVTAGPAGRDADLRVAEREMLAIRIAACERMATADALARSMHHTVLDYHYHLLDEHSSDIRELQIEIDRMKEQLQQLHEHSTLLPTPPTPPLPPPTEAVTEDSPAALSRTDADADADADASAESRRETHADGEVGGDGGGDGGGSDALQLPAESSPLQPSQSGWRSHSRSQSEMQWHAQLTTKLQSLQSQVESLQSLQQASLSQEEVSQHLSSLADLYHALEDQLEDLTSKVGWMQAKTLSQASSKIIRQGQERTASQHSLPAETAAASSSTTATAAAELVAAAEQQLRKDLESALKDLKAQSQDIDDIRTRLEAMERSKEAVAKAEEVVSEKPYVTKTELEELQNFTHTALEELTISLKGLDGNISDLNVDMQHAAKDVGRLLVQVRQLQQQYEDLAASVGMSRHGSAGAAASAAPGGILSRNTTGLGGGAVAVASGKDGGGPEIPPPSSV